MLHRILTTPLLKIGEVRLVELLLYQGRQPTLFTQLRKDVLNSLGMLGFEVRVRRLLELELDPLLPEMPAVRVPLDVLEEYGPRLLDRTLDLPQQPGPLGDEGGLDEDIDLGRVDLGLVDLNGRVETALTSLQVGPRNYGFNAVWDFHEHCLMDVPSDIDTPALLLEVGKLQADAGPADGDEECGRAEIDVPDLLLLAVLRRHPTGVPEPELVVKCTGHQAPLIKGRDPRKVTLRLLKIQILSPGDYLAVFQLRDVEERSLYLGFECPAFGGLCLRAGKDVAEILIELGANVLLQLRLGLGRAILGVFGLDLGTVLGEQIRRPEFGEGAGVRELAKALKVPTVLVHGDVDDAEEDGKDLVVGLLALLILDILVPERVGEEVLANTACTALKKPRQKSAGKEREGKGEKKNSWKGCINTGRGLGC